MEEQVLSRRYCRKCEKPLPNRVKVEGTWRVINRRKFCLKCSPFGAHNTKRDDPSRPSRTSTKEGARQAWRVSAQQAFDRARAFKRELVELSGGACSRCGYKRYIGALEFHHTDPQTKLFSLAAGNLRAKAREHVLAEWAKCILLCSNCHREVEAGLE